MFCLKILINDIIVSVFIFRGEVCMEDVLKGNIKETIKFLPEEKQKIILRLTEIFEGEEDTILEYCEREFIDVN